MGEVFTPGRRAVLSAVTVNLIGVLALFLTGAMSVQIGRDLGVRPTVVGALTSAFALSTLLMTAILARQVGRWGIRRSLHISTTASAVALLLAGLSPGVPWLAAALLLGGAANALGQPAGNALVAAQVPPDRYGIGFGIKQSAIPLATLLGGLAVPTVALTIGWRVAYFVAAALAVAAVAIVPGDRPMPVGRAEQPVPGPQRPGLRLLAVGVGAAVFAATSIGALGAAGAVAVGLSEAAAGYLIAAGGLAGLTIRLAAGYAADRARFDPLRAVSLLCLLGAVGWLAMATGLPAAFTTGLLVANAFGWGWPGLQHLAVALRFPTATAAASGVSQTGTAAGLLAGPATLGLVVTAAGWSAAWWCAASAAIAGAALIAVAGRQLPANVPRPR